MDELDAKGEGEKSQGKMLCHCQPTQPNLDKLKPNFYDLVTANLLATKEREREPIINLNRATGEERRNWMQMKKREAPGEEEEGRVTMQLRLPRSNQLRLPRSNQLRRSCSNQLRLPQTTFGYVTDTADTRSSPFGLIKDNNLMKPTTTWSGLCFKETCEK